MDIEKLIADLKAQGLEEEQILSSLEQMAQEQKITPEDFEKAKQLLGLIDKDDTQQHENDDKAQASKLFGLKF